MQTTALQDANLVQENEVVVSDDFASLLKKEFKPKTTQAEAAVQHAVRTLARQALEQSVTISADAYQTIQAVI